ncbi:hypothetical protein [Rudaea sp.]|uniref:hypothetical protein n=1 Tax=Rudaea sp. TaxID=2136325 RepID=UPI003784EAAD
MNFLLAKSYVRFVADLRSRGTRYIECRELLAATSVFIWMKLPPRARFSRNRCGHAPCMHAFDRVWAR